MQTLSIRLPERGFNQLRELSERHTRKLSDEVRRTLMLGLEAQDVDFDRSDFLPTH